MNPRVGTGSRRDLFRTVGIVAASGLAACATRTEHQTDIPPPAGDLPDIRSDADVARLLPRLSNWGRWGAADRLGTLNFITPARRAAAARLVRAGRSISLSRQSSPKAIERGQHEARSGRWEAATSSGWSSTASR